MPGQIGVPPRTRLLLPALSSLCFYLTVRPILRDSALALPQDEAVRLAAIAKPLTTNTSSWGGPPGPSRRMRGLPACSRPVHQGWPIILRI